MLWSLDRSVIYGCLVGSTCKFCQNKYKSKPEQVAYKWFISSISEIVFRSNKIANIKISRRLDG